LGPVGIGLFLTFIGLNETGLVRLGVLRTTFLSFFLGITPGS
jgi:xanthine/uracil/vitamin C permease (AzgA family)